MESHIFWFVHQAACFVAPPRGLFQWLHPGSTVDNILYNISYILYVFYFAVIITMDKKVRHRRVEDEFVMQPCIPCSV